MTAPHPASTPAPGTSFDVAMLRLHLAVAMAAADETLHDAELEALAAFVSSIDVSEPQRGYLGQMLAVLVQQPPSIEALFSSLAQHVDDPQLARALMHELRAIAQSDDEIDPREIEFMERVCESLGVEPATLEGEREHIDSSAMTPELTAFIRSLVPADLAA